MGVQSSATIVGAASPLEHKPPAATSTSPTRTFKPHQSSVGTTPPNYEYRLTATAHLQRLAQIARKQTRGSSVDWQDAVQTAQVKLIVAIKAGKFTHGTEADFDRWAVTVAK